MITASLISFVNDFKLPGEKGTIVFEADIRFVTVKKTIILESQVHIIHLYVKQLDIIYLLNPEIKKQAIPDMIYSNTVIGYHANRSLYTNGASAKHGHYTLLIAPNIEKQKGILQ
jgi:hypothetical protein